MTTRRRTKAAAKQTKPEPDVPEAVVAESSAVAECPVAAPEPQPPPVAAAAAEPAAAAPDPVVRLEGALLIRSAADVVTRLRKALGTGSLRIDASGVTQVDTAGLQLLVAAVATAKRDGAKCEWLGASQALHDGARRLGLDASLALPAAG